MSNVEGTASTEYGHSRKHVLQYSMDGITTQFYATHLTFKNTPSTRTLTLMLCHGLAMSKWFLIVDDESSAVSHQQP